LHVHLVVVGLSHDTTRIELREKLRIPTAGVPDALASLRACPELRECLILSTCNRTEIYAVMARRGHDAPIIAWIGQYCGVAEAEYHSHLYRHSGHKAVEHLFRVAAGLDSLVVGEAQILGQIKMSYAAASQAGCTGAQLNPLLHQAIAVGKRARTETGIGQGASSVSAVAVQLAKSIFGRLEGHTVLILGAGKMSELVMASLVTNGADQVVVANRTREKAEALAAHYGGRVVTLDELPAALAAADITLAAADVQAPIITRAQVAAAMHARRGRPGFFIDIAVPRNIADDVGTLDDVFVYNIDDLQSIVQADLARRHTEIERVEAIIAEAVLAYQQRLRAQETVPLITALRERLEGQQRVEMEKLVGRLRHLSPEDHAAIQHAMRALVNTISHQPLIQIKEYASQEDAATKLQAVCELFGLSPELAARSDDHHEEAPTP
jgi:glutamyl-tRNA reductase